MDEELDQGMEAMDVGLELGQEQGKDLDLDEELDQGMEAMDVA